MTYKLELTKPDNIRGSIHGKIDAYIKHKDSFTVVDFKTTNINENKISDVKFDGKGCAICMACSSVLTEITKGKNLDDVRKIEKNDVLSELGLEHLQAVRIKCALLSLKVLKSALYTYIGKHLENSEDIDKLKEEAANLY